MSWGVHKIEVICVTDFYPRQELPYGIVASGEKSCPSRRQAGGRHVFVGGPMCKNHYTFIYECFIIHSIFTLLWQPYAKKCLTYVFLAFYIPLPLIVIFVTVFLRKCLNYEMEEILLHGISFHFCAPALHSHVSQLNPPR